MNPTTFEQILKVVKNQDPEAEWIKFTELSIKKHMTDIIQTFPITSEVCALYEKLADDLDQLEKDDA